MSRLALSCVSLSALGSAEGHVISSRCIHDILTVVLQAGQPKLKESLHRRLSEQQQAVFYANYGLLLLAAGRLDAAREIVNTYQKKSAL